MKTSKLINILKTFSTEEVKLFDKFLASPFHNSGKNCKPLFRVMKKYYPDFKTDMISYENLHKKLYPGSKFNKQVMWNLSSALEKMAKEFLEQIALRNDKFTRMELAISEFSTRKLAYNYSQALGEMEKAIEKTGLDYDHFDKRLHMEIYKQDYYFLTDKIQFKGDSTLKSAEYQLILFLKMNVTALRDLRILEEYHNYKIDTNLPLEIAGNVNYDAIIEYAKRKNYEYTYLIELYYHSLMMLLKPSNTRHVAKFRELYQASYKKLTDNEQSTMMHWLINYCLYNLDLSKDENNRMVFELNDFRLKEGLAFYPDDQLSKTIYLQIFNSALRANEIEWALEFINKYTVKLLPEFRETMKCQAYAFLYFHTKEYSKALNYLYKVEFIEIMDKLQTRILTAKTHYELNDMETLLNYIDSTKHFLNCNPSISEVIRIQIHTFIKYVHKIVFLRESKDLAEINSIKKEITSIEEIASKRWLLEKLAELADTVK
ncbi:MAG: hypothetical protein IAE90_05120 [Ignavibacteria bacterium]|nr:hypothetical protein [Ignavibacteria bacterium]